jgi:hypothetical protein
VGRLVPSGSISLKVETKPRKPSLFSRTLRRRPPSRNQRSSTSVIYTLAHSEQRFVVSVQSVAVRSLQLCWCSLLSQKTLSRSNFPLGQSGTLIRSSNLQSPNCATGRLAHFKRLADSISPSVTGYRCLKRTFSSIMNHTSLGLTCIYD